MISELVKCFAISYYRLNTFLMSNCSSCRLITTTSRSPRSIDLPRAWRICRDRHFSLQLFLYSCTAMTIVPFCESFAFLPIIYLRGSLSKYCTWPFTGGVSFSARHAAAIRERWKSAISGNWQCQNKYSRDVPILMQQKWLNSFPFLSTRFSHYVDIFYTPWSSQRSLSLALVQWRVANMVMVYGWLVKMWR